MEKLEKLISKTATIKNNSKNKIWFTNSAREGWEAILTNIPSVKNILLPSYIGITDKEGSGIFDPVISSKVEYDFYLINTDLSISIDRLEEKLISNNYQVVLLVHYFGFQIPDLEKVIKICKKHDVIIVEDCAHLYNYNYKSKTLAGTVGDFAFYSLHKNFPVKEGGLLVKNTELDFDFTSNYSPNLPLDIFSYDFEEIVKKRINNFKLLDKLIENVKGVRPLKRFKEGDIPHTYPIIVNDGLREKLYFWLIQQEITLIALYYRMINDLTDPQYGSMISISNNILNLPIHQDIEPLDLERIVRNINEGLNEISV